MTTYVPVHAQVMATQRIGDSYVRITFGGPEMAKLGSDYAVLDQRIKLIFTESGHPPKLPVEGDWYQNWLAMDERERGVMRTYSIREQRMTAETTEYDVDFVLHGDGNGGQAGPASSWADEATVGDEIVLVGPARSSNGAAGHNGIAFLPGNASHVFMVGDETAVPAIGRILSDIAQSSPETETLKSGLVVIELPSDADINDLRNDFHIPTGFDVVWLARNGAARGEKTHVALAEGIGVEHRLEATHLGPRCAVHGGCDVEDLVWGEPGHVTDKHYFWIAGESGIVRSLRRLLVKQCGFKKDQISFMGYWKDSCLC